MNVPEDWTASSITTNGVKLKYYRVGEGPPVILAHGLFDSGRCWAPIISELKSDYSIVAYDARGHGQSGAPESGYGISDRVADLLGLTRSLSLTDPIVIGHSLGGSTAAWTAAEHPDKIRGVILEDPAGIHGEPEIGAKERAKMVRRRVDEKTDASVAELIQEYEDRSQALARRLVTADKECSPQIAKYAQHGYPPLSEAFEQITCPALVLRSDGPPAERADDLAVAANLSEGRLVHLHGAGHCVIRDCYDAAMAEITTYLYMHSSQ